MHMYTTCVQVPLKIHAIVFACKHSRKTSFSQDHNRSMCVFSSVFCTGLRYICSVHGRFVSGHYGTPNMTKIIQCRSPFYRSRLSLFQSMVVPPVAIVFSSIDGRSPGIERRSPGIDRRSTSIDRRSPVLYRPATCTYTGAPLLKGCGQLCPCAHPHGCNNVRYSCASA